MENKKWYQSKTIIGALVTVLAAFAGMFGIDVSQGAQVELADVIIGLFTAAAGGFTVYGRIKADQKIEK